VSANKHDGVNVIHCWGKFVRCSTLNQSYGHLVWLAMLGKLITTTAIFWTISVLLNSPGIKNTQEPPWVAGKNLCGCCSCVVVVAIHTRLWLIEAWGMVIARHCNLALITPPVQWSEGRSTNVDCSILFCTFI